MNLTPKGLQVEKCLKDQITGKDLSIDANMVLGYIMLEIK